jgi:hypothetical protein
LCGEESVCAGAVIETASDAIKRKCKILILCTRLSSNDGRYRLPNYKEGRVKKSGLGTTWILSGLQIRKPRIFEEGGCRADFPK